MASNQQVFVYDRRSQHFVRISASANGEAAPYSSHGSLLPGGGHPSEEGSRVAFASEATSLVRDDSNGVADVFVRQPR